MNEDYVEEEHIGKTIIDELFTKTRLSQKQPGNRLWVNNEERHLPPDLDNADLPSTDNADNATTNDISPPPALELTQSKQSEQPTYTYVHPTSKAIAKPDTYKPTHRLTGKQPPSIVGQHHNILVTKEISLENNEDMDEKQFLWRQS
eukprot:4679317-Amphidinium_carterae.4